MFSKNETPMTVVITLDLPELEVTKFYKESLNLKQTEELNSTYIETGGNLAPFLKLYNMRNHLQAVVISLSFLL